MRAASGSRREDPIVDLPRHEYYDGHELVVFSEDRDTGLRAVLALHRLSPRCAFGGTRMRAYASDGAAVSDALRLSRAMTFTCAVAGVACGGGTGVIIGDPRPDRRRALLSSYAAALNRLRGQFVTGADVGISLDDLLVMGRTSPYVLGRRGTDTAEPTAFGVYWGIRAALGHRSGSDRDLCGVRVAVQGLGEVGMRLCRLLDRAGARLVVADRDAARVATAVAEFGATAVPPADVLTADVDVVAPCALGGVLTGPVIERMRATVVAGAADNQLADPGSAQLLAERGILYAPDYVVNAGGVINNAALLAGPENYDRHEVLRKARGIHDTLLEVFRIAALDGVDVTAAADRLARTRMMNLAVAVDRRQGRDW